MVPLPRTGGRDERAASAPSRVVIERVRPAVDGGRFPIKRTVGETVEVRADVFADGHDRLAVVLRYRAASETAWSEVPLLPEGNDVWRGSFVVARLEPHLYTVVAWIDEFASWREGLAKKVAAATAERVDLQVGAELVTQAARRASGEDAVWLERRAQELSGAAAPEAGLDPRLAEIVARHPDHGGAAIHEPALRVDVDRERARFGAWYELFPRSFGRRADRHGTLRDCEAQLARVAAMGFDVLYLPPVHPIGTTKRKGRNNAPAAEAGDVGSPWAIGGAEGGHVALHPELGTLDDFRRLVARAAEHGLEIALDLAFQCSPDHPWVREHPQWFRRRPDGTVQYAENPPKKYEDIYPLNFDTADWRALWDELRGVVRFWISQGVRIFRVDNPHTKAFPFWEWLIADTRGEHPEVLFLSEAFTRPKVMYRLAKLGFTQSYTYFAWRNTKRELTEYLHELTRTDVREFFRPNFWPNTPDILTEYLQFGGRPAFMTRVALAATLGASYGIYGPAFELAEGRARNPGGEEYLDSEKYQLRQWNVDDPSGLAGYIARLNRIRRENAALQSDAGLRFHTVDNDNLMAYSKSTPDGSNVILVVVNLDPHHEHSGWLELALGGLSHEGQSYQVHDLLTDARYFWSGPRNYVELDPHSSPAHVFRLRRKVRTERDFDYFL